MVPSTLEAAIQGKLRNWGIISTSNFAKVPTLQAAAWAAEVSVADDFGLFDAEHKPA